MALGRGIGNNIWVIDQPSRDITFKSPWRGAALTFAMADQDTSPIFGTRVLKQLKHRLLSFLNGFLMQI